MKSWLLCVLAALICGVFAATSSGQFLDTKNTKPAFSQEGFTGTVPELSAPDTTVMTVSATEPMTINAALRYSIIRQESIPPNAVNTSVFGISVKTGVIYTTDVVPTVEVVTAFILSLEVADSDGTGLTDEAVAIVNVTDVNNHAPEFSPTLYHMTVVENTLGDIGRVNVTDGDEPGTGNWEAKFSTSDDPHGYFTIRTDAQTNQGILSVVKSLDGDTLKEHNLTLRVENVNPIISESSSTATVFVTVVNEEAPYFTEDPIKLVVPQDVLPGTSLKSDIAVENLSARFETTADQRNWLDSIRNTGESLANMSPTHVKNKVCTVEIKVTAVTGLSTTATVQISMAETNVFAPQLSPPSGFICKNGGPLNSALVLRAVDEDLAAPYSFDTPWVLSNDKWIVTQVNDTRTVLQPGLDIQSGVYEVTVMVSDSGTLHSSAHVKVTLCTCDSFGGCQSATALSANLGIDLIVFIIVVIMIALIPLAILGVELVKVLRRCHECKYPEVEEPEAQPQGNAINCGDQGCVEGNTITVNPNLLRKLHDGPDDFDQQQIISDTAHHTLSVPTHPCKSLNDIEDCISKRLEAAENDLDVPPYDIALIFNYEEDDSLDGSLSSIVSSSSEHDQDYDYLNDWEPQFRKIANNDNKSKGDEANECY